MKNYKELKVWKKGIDVVKMTYQISKSFPAEEKFGLVSQMTKAAVSIPANIAEGSSRNSDKDYSRFLQIALGSAFELQTYIIITKELNWQANNIIELENSLEEVIKMLHSFINTLKKANS